jgi:hypothetical protein
MKNYMIRHGFSFRKDNNEVVGGGQTIELPDDVAANHLHKLEEVVDEVAAVEAAKTSGKKAPEPAAVDPK